jgi:integrase/recombinase XerD
VHQEPLDPLNTEDLRRMLATCRRRSLSGDRDRSLLLSLLDTGCRASEFLALSVGDLDLQTGALSLRLTKGKRPRTVFVGRTALREVSRYLRGRADAAPADPLWVTRDGARLRYSGLVSLLRRRARAARVPAPMPHAFRRAFALASLRQGMDVVSLQRLLGHADLSVISRYTKQTKEDLRAVHEEHGPVDSLLRG